MLILFRFTVPSKTSSPKVVNPAFPDNDLRGLIVHGVPEAC